MTKRISKFLSILLVICMVASMVPATVFAAETPSKLYLKPNSNWLVDGARFAAYFFGNGETWVDATAMGDGYYEVTVPSGYPSVIFCRMNPSATANNWNNKWNQTSDLTIPTDGTNCYTVAEGAWDKGAGSWSTYTVAPAETDPVVTEPAVVDYYLVGYINGANYGCEEDYANLGEYKFVDGKLVATFDADSYVFVKTGDNANWYLAESYCTDTTVTLIKDKSEKMLVPGGVEITFTLVVNADGTLTLSYETAECVHSYNGVVTTPATCEGEGITTYTCSKCGNSYTVVIGATGHNYASEVTTAATCTTSGVTTYTCANCDDSYTETINPSGHSFVNGKCSVCGAVDPNCEHSYTSQVTTEPTCLGTGVKLYTCTKCGDVYEEEIPSNGHDYVITVVAPTCENNGYTVHACKNCTYSYNDTPVNPIGHNYSSVVTAPTCTEKGYTTYTCANCGNVYTWNETAATGHTYAGGKCTSCGIAQEGYVAEYYLYGYINGADYGYDQAGQYKFVNGSLTVTITETSYVAVKTADLSVWYATNGWLGEVNTATLYQFADPYAVSANKLYVPAGEVTFTLVDNGNDTLTLSYTVAAADCEHPLHSTDGICTSCGASVAHSYATGICTVCGASDPDYVPVEYYLFGYINGTDYGEYDDAASTGYFRMWPSGDLNTFANTFTFTSDSYIAVKTGDNTKWYMTDGWQGEVTSVTLYDTTTLDETADKLFIPGGNRVKVTLVVNSDSTMTLSYEILEAVTCEHPSHSTDGICTTCQQTVAHTYVDGVCSVCGAADPDYSTPTEPSEPAVVDYYLVGYINGANYGCEEDYANLGEYKFVDGKLVATFDADSYVFVKTGDNANWYLAESYCTDTTVTLIKDKSEKMLVPGGVEITFTLVVNADGTLTLSYVAAEQPHEHSYTGVVTEPTCTEAGYTTYICDCGDSYVADEVPATGHDYVDGICANCGAKDPDYVEPTDPTEPVEGGYVLVTDAADITAGGQFVIVANNAGTYRALGTTIASKVAAADVTISGNVATGENLPIWTIEATSGGIALSVDGNYLAYSSGTSFKSATSAYEWGVTAGENGGFVFNATATTRGIYYQISGDRFGAYATSNASSSSYVSELLVFKYVEGTTEPEEPVAVDYYLVGYINGANYGCEEDYANLGEYKFVDGKLVATFDVDSYVFVKTGDNANWYLAESYCTDTTVTLIKDKSEKMLVPGGVEITFTLVVNADGTLTLSYVAAEQPHEHSYTGVVTEPTCTEAGYTTYICDCGDSYVADEVPATGHDYVDGICANCGAKDPDYSEPTDPTEPEEPVAVDYYLIGYIDGADYGDGDDYANFGDHKFVNGTVTVTFSQESYVCVKDTNMVWYMTDGWLGTVSSATLYNTQTTTATDPTNDPFNKLYVPAGEVTFTLVVNEDGTLTLSYVTAEEPVELPEVTAKSFSLSFEDEILVNFYYTISDETDVVDHGMLVFYSDPGTADYAKADVIYNDATFDTTKARYGITTTGIAAKEMGDTRYYVGYAKLSDGTYIYSTMYDYSPKKYAMNMLGKTTTSDKQKALCVAMLNYGAAAQTYFGYNTDSLMNAELTAEQQALVIAYDASLFTGAVAVDANKIGDFAATSTGFSKKSATVSFEGAFAINYYFTPSAAVSGEMTLYCWNPETYASVDTLTADNATCAVAMVDAGDGRYWADVTGIPAKTLDDTYYVAAVYTDASGNTYCTGVVAYSLSKYCMNNASGTMGELAQATAMYGYYAKLYFTN